MDRQVLFVIMVVIPVSLIAVPMLLAARRGRRAERARRDADR